MRIFLGACCPSIPAGYEPNGRWTKEKAREWSERTGWRSGCNYIPATAINQIEMWQASTFDPETIDKELGWAEELGFNTMRVYLSSVVWRNEAESFKQRIDRFLVLAAGHRDQAAVRILRRLLEPPFRDRAAACAETRDT